MTFHPSPLDREEVAQRVGSSTDCVLAAPWGDSLVQCCALTEPGRDKSGAFGRDEDEVP